MWNPFRRKSAAHFTRQLDALDARRVAYVRKRGITYPAGVLDRRERRFQRRMGRLLDRRQQAIRRERGRGR